MISYSTLVRHLLFTICLFFAYFASTWAQRTITGNVSDADSEEPLIGVTVLAVGVDMVGTVSDFEGNYEINVPESATQLQFSYVGYLTITVDIEGPVVDVQMSGGIITLEETVVIGYSTQKVKEVTSAVTSVKADEFNQGNVQNPIGLLQGKVAGLSIAKVGGDPNGGFAIQLRGLNTFGQNTSPLIVIDGVQGASLDNVDPQDIESIDVLKDASATSIYGSRGTNGVIIVTTKRGQEDQASITYNGYVTLENVDQKPSVLNATDYLSFNGTTDFGSDTDWFDEITRDAFTHVHNLSLTGGTSKTSYRISANYRDGEGVGIGNGFDQLNGRINVNQKGLNDRLSITATLSSTVRNESYIPGEAFGFARRYNPTAPIFSDDALSAEWGGYFQRQDFNFINPVSVVQQNNLDGKKNRILGSLRGEIEIIKDLKVSATYSREKNNNNFSQYWSKESFYTPYAISSDKGYAQKLSEEFTQEQFQSTILYRRQLADIEFSILAGYNWQEGTFENFFARNAGFITDEFKDNNLGQGEDLIDGEALLGSFRTRNRLISYVSRLTANWQDRVYLTLNFNREGSSKFGPNNRWGNFYGASMGIDLMKFVNLDIFDRFKIRAGFGQTGNVPNDDFAYQLTYNPQGFFFSQGAFIPAFGPSRNSNPDLKWETKQELNIGLDINLFDYALGVTIDYYQVDVKDVLYNAPVRVPPNLVDRKLLNVGEMENSGIELVLDWTGINTGDFTYAPTLNFTKFFETKVNKIESEETTGDGIIRVGGLGAPFFTGINAGQAQAGQPIGQLFGPIFSGISETGEFIFEDIDGDGAFDPSKDITAIGNGLPEFQIGLNNKFSYKALDATIFFRGVFGHELLNLANARYGVPSAINVQNGAEIAKNYRDVSDNPTYSNLYIEEASYVKLDNASIGYTFDIKKADIDKLRIYISGNNLFTITDYSGVDPEVRYTDGGSALAPGIDRESTYITTRSFSFGLNLGF